MADSTLLTWSTGVTVANVKDWIASADRDKIAEFLRLRFLERYFDTVNGSANGFLLMAVCCLVVEALESFRQGWATSDRHGERAFSSFFERYPEVRSLHGVAPQFYKHIRCGILHQAETSGGWTLTRKAPESLVNVAGKRVNAVKLHSALRTCLDKYITELKHAPITDEIWVNCLTKLYATIRNCE